MPRKLRPGEKATEAARATPPQGAQPETPKAATKTSEQEFEERPDIQFARDFDRDLTFALRWEAAQEMESEFEDELEQALVDEADAEPWAARIMRQAWNADPQARDVDDFARFRMPADAYKAMKISDPIEAMLFAQASALHTNMIFTLSQATRLGLSKPELMTLYFGNSTKLASAFGKHADTLQRYRKKGQQEVTIKYERLARGDKTKKQNQPL